MNTYAIYKENTGEIVNTITTNDVATLALNVPVGCAYVTSEFPLTEELRVVMGVVEKLPISPNVFSTFDYAKGLWVEDPVLKEQYLRTEKYKARELLINAGFPYNGSTFQIDDASRTSISGKVVYLQEMPSVTTVNWKALDNTVVGFTRAEFTKFACAASDYYENIILTT
jgi:hypothetical protein